MAFSFLQELQISGVILLLGVVALYIWSKRSQSSSLPVHWPVVGPLPAFIANIENFYEYGTGVLSISGQSYKARSNGKQFFFTCDPENIRYIFTTNRENFPKGEEMAEMFDIVRGSFITTDGESWRRQRTSIQRILTSPSLLAFMATCCHNKVENSLIPFMSSKASSGAQFDMNDLIARFVFDLVAMPIFGVDPGCLSPADMTPLHVSTAMDTVMEAALFRQALPASYWKAMRWLNIGLERRLAVARKLVDGFITEMLIARRRNTRITTTDDKTTEAAASVDILSSYINDPDYNDESLRVTLVAYMIAGRDSISTALTWLVYNIANNPHVLCGIRNELSPIASRKAAANAGANNNSDMIIFEAEETKALVYLHATVLESLRLYPPIPLERKMVVSNDKMPSGHEVLRDDIIIISIYSVGRMEDIWGKDCRDFKPERWISEDGCKLRYIPSHKFLVFNSGPRMCLGKDIAMSHIKTVLASMVWNFHVDMVEGQVVKPKLSGILQMKTGLMVKLRRRHGT